MFRKKLAALAVATTMIVASGVPVFAAETDAPIGGGEEIVYEN